MGRTRRYIKRNLLLSSSSTTVLSPFTSIPAGFFPIGLLRLLLRLVVFVIFLSSFSFPGFAWVWLFFYPYAWVLLPAFTFLSFFSIPVSFYLHSFVLVSRLGDHSMVLALLFVLVFGLSFCVSGRIFKGIILMAAKEKN